MLIEIRQAGRRARPLDGWSVPIEPLLRNRPVATAEHVSSLAVFPHDLT